MSTRRLPHIVLVCADSAAALAAKCDSPKTRLLLRLGYSFRQMLDLYGTRSMSSALLRFCVSHNPDFLQLFACASWEGVHAASVLRV